MVSTSIFYLCMQLDRNVIPKKNSIVCLQGFVAKIIGDKRRKAVKFTQKRVGLMNEILNSIRLIKMYGWEDSFSKQIKGIL
jgi:hypothetical protein